MTPARNRVTPLGTIVAAPGRGAWMGNRGRLHEGSGTRDIVRNHRGKAWITCRLTFRDYRAAQWHPHHYTPLFFLDEAVALAAGHRPCAECRRADYNGYRDAWVDALGGPRPSARELDARLHAERLGPPAPRQPWRSLPVGAYVLLDDEPAVVLDDHLARYEMAANAYGGHLARPRRGTAHVLTPPASLAVLRAGYPLALAPLPVRAG